MGYAARGCLCMISCFFAASDLVGVGAVPLTGATGPRTVFWAFSQWDGLKAEIFLLSSEEPPGKFNPSDCAGYFGSPRPADLARWRCLRECACEFDLHFCVLPEVPM